MSTTNPPEIPPEQRPVTASTSPANSVMRELAVAILPIFFSSFLFAAMLETYKDNISSRKDLVIDFYRPMREAQTECRSEQNQQFLKHSDQASTFALMVQEFDHVASGDPQTLSPEYYVLPTSLLKATNQLNTESNELKIKVDTCTAALYRKYEEVALATGTYDRFLEIENKRIATVNKLLDERSRLANAVAQNANLPSVMDTLRKSLGPEAETPEGRREMSGKIHEIGDITVEGFEKISKNEQDVYNVDLEADTQLISLFANEVSRRYKRNLFSMIFRN
ncbi:hypothetical protein E2553_38315 [Paraburkholderia dipogonis]|uniref:Uncharacterized protein n=1 Tax=Paraburkholderia dipogonis TaxID=1211383 RepID=A0A4Y8MIS8_9BURK|nr:hypothetical protein [Paraburkholderia dipogonis]TFE37349.1 hypothetical protein E2553_38315 [Paraburkholderia dipogonis]